MVDLFVFGSSSEQRQFGETRVCSAPKITDVYHTPSMSI